MVMKYGGGSLGVKLLKKAMNFRALQFKYVLDLSFCFAL